MGFHSSAGMETGPLDGASKKRPNVKWPKKRIDLTIKSNFRVEHSKLNVNPIPVVRFMPKLGCQDY